MEAVTSVKSPGIKVAQAAVKIDKVKKQEVAQGTGELLTEELQKKEEDVVKGQEVKELTKIAAAVEEFAEPKEWTLKIRVDEKTDQTVVQIVSKDSGKVIRQIPAEELLDLAAKMEELVGVLVNEKA